MVQISVYTYCLAIKGYHSTRPIKVAISGSNLSGIRDVFIFVLKRIINGFFVEIIHKPSVSVH